MEEHQGDEESELVRGILDSHGYLKNNHAEFDKLAEALWMEEFMNK